MLKFAARISEQSLRLGEWMDWSDSYYTLSDENNYTIWQMLKLCWQRGWLYRGHDVMPWCPRCGTGISDMEINEGRQKVQHTSVYVRLPLVDRPNEYLLVWTTTPWTLPANVAAAVNPALTYARIEQDGNIYYLSEEVVPKLNTKLRGREHGEAKVVGTLSGSDMLGWRYRGPFDELPAWQREAGRGAAGETSRAPTVAASGAARGKGAAGETSRAPTLAASESAQADFVAEGHSEGTVANSVASPTSPYEHRVIAWNEVSAAEGTGIVHIAPGAGKEDFALGRENNLPTLAPIDDSGIYVEGYDWLTGQQVGEVAHPIFESLREKGLFYQTESYEHVYPHCWRCGSELVFRLVDEWFISMGNLEAPSDNLRKRLVRIVEAPDMTWIPSFGRERELDWLRNMEDWMISKKRYYGLALPIYPCPQCGTFEVIGGKDELRERAVEGWEAFEGHSPHRPWVDEVKIHCATCGSVVSRIPDVGNPWLDAGIVPFSTMHYSTNREYWRQWFPADFITEGFAGQFRNWFYSLLVMAAALEDTAPFKTVLGFGTLLDQTGREFHKSWGNSIDFDKAAEIVGADTMRWLFASAAPEQDLRFPRIPSEAEAAQAREAGQPPRLSRSVDAGARPAGQAVERLLVLCHLRQYRRLRSDGAHAQRRAAQRPGPLGALRAATHGPGGDDASACLRHRACHRGDRRVRRESLELVCAPQPPPLLEERGGRRQSGRVPHALRVPGDDDEAARAAHAVPRGVALPESGALGELHRDARACICATGRWRMRR